jgi:hypothetical protein
VLSSVVDSNVNRIDQGLEGSVENHPAAAWADNLQELANATRRRVAEETSGPNFGSFWNARRAA